MMTMHFIDNKLRDTFTSCCFIRVDTRLRLFETGDLLRQFLMAQLVNELVQLFRDYKCPSIDDITCGP